MLIYYEKYFCKKDAWHREKFLKMGIGRKYVKFLIKEYKNTVSAKGGPASGGGGRARNLPRCRAGLTL